MKACSLEGKKTGGFASQGPVLLSDVTSMKALSGLKGGRVIRLVRLQHGENDACPHIGQGAYSDGMAFALSSLALVGVPGPAFLLGRLPGKLVQGKEPRFDAAQPPVRLGVVATLKQHRRGPGQSLQTPCIRRAGALITDLGEQTRSKAFACSGQRAPDLVVFMLQKKGGNFLLILGDLFNQRQQLRASVICCTEAPIAACGVGEVCRKIRVEWCCTEAFNCKATG